MSGSSRFRSMAKRVLSGSAGRRILGPWARGATRLHYTQRLAAWADAAGPGFRIDSTSPGYRYAKRYDLYSRILDSEDLAARQIAYTEFGVASGESIRWWLAHNTHPESRFVGFDTFTGLPEDWRPGAPSGAFSTEGRAPQVEDSRCRFVVGLFQETLAGFLEGGEIDRAPVRVVHLDADLYSSTLFVLTRIASHLRQGDVLLFDEFADALHEFRAFEDFRAAYGGRYRPLGAVNGCAQVAIRVD